MECKVSNLKPVTQITSDNIVATNVKNISFSCSNINREFSVEALGAVLINHPCDCDLALDGDLLPWMYPCLTVNNNLHMEVLQIIPAAWTRIR